MAESTANDIDFLPYDTSSDPLDLSYCGITYFPPSVVDAPSEPQQMNSLTQERKEELLYKINDPRNPEQVASWIKECRLLKLELDIDRVARLAVFRNDLPIVEYLVNNEKADVKRRDVRGRPAIFYTTRINGLPTMLNYLYSQMNDEPTPQELNHQDSPNQLTPLHYATNYHSVECVQLLLRKGADMNIKDDQGLTPKDIVRYGTSDDTLSERGKRTVLLFAFVDLIQLYSGLPLIVGSLSRPDGCESMQEWLPLNKLLADIICFDSLRTLLRESIRIHIPWASGIIACAALERFIIEIGWLGVDCGSTLIDDYLSSFRGPVTVPGNPKFHYREPSYKSDFKCKYPYVSIVFPCLVLWAKSTYSQARKNAQESRVIEYGSFAENLAPFERTLDETYYPGLPAEVLRNRNEDQVISRETLSSNQPILMVSQLWIWKVGNNILTAYSAEELFLELDRQDAARRGHESPPETESQSLQPGMGTMGEHTTTSGAIMVGLIIARHISAFGKLQANNRFKSPLDIFETGVVRILLDVENYTSPNKSLPRDGVEIEREFLHRIADIREELVMIQQILDQQREYLQNLIQDAEDYELQDFLKKETYDWYEKRDRENWERVKLSVAEVDKYQKRAKKLDRDAERVEKVIQDQLNLKRTYASISDARTGLILSAAVVGFTVVTIIFAPLAFMTSLFALPVDNLLGNQYDIAGTSGEDPKAAYPIRYIATWFAVAELVSLVVTAFLVVLCLWLFRWSAAKQGNHSEEKRIGSRDSSNRLKKDSETEKIADEKKPELDHEWTNIRRRVPNIFGRKKHLGPGDA